MIDRKKAKQQILAAAREMAKAYPSQDYCYAREQFGLLGMIRRITGIIMPSARQCWEYVGLDRSAIVDEFEFAQDDISRASPEACIDSRVKEMLNAPTYSSAHS